jgi:hypothetical protein
MQRPQSEELADFALKLPLGNAQKPGHLPDIKVGASGNFQVLVRMLSA